MSAKPKPSEEVEYREVTINGQTVRLRKLNLKHPFEKGDAVKLVRSTRGYRN